MRDEMQSRWDQNLDRVQSLVELYERESGSRPGRRGVKDADVLRAAVVFLHATLEDLLRTLLARRWPLTNMAELLDRIPFAWKKDKLSLSELVPHRDRKVGEIIEDAVEAYLETSNFNNVGDVKEALRRSGIDLGIADERARRLAAMMSRRHWIVHRADRNMTDGRKGQQVAQTLSVRQVTIWINTVKALGNDVLARL